MISAKSQPASPAHHALSPKEAEVVALWRRATLFRSRFTDLAGVPVNILYPGRPNDARGADFKEALVRWNGLVRRGCIEIHTRASAWREHSHQRDPTYNNVVLHVVWEGDTGEETRRQDGTVVPTVELGGGNFVRPSGEPVRTCQTDRRRLSGVELRSAIAALGDARLEAKAWEFGSQSQKLGPEQALYLGLLEGLGYSRNRQAFRDLGRLLPLATMQQGLSNCGDGEFTRRRLEAWLLGEGGFLSRGFPISSRERRYRQGLERLWSVRAEDGRKIGPAWDLFKIRPANHPVRRILAFSHLLWRFRRQGLLMGVLEAVRNAAEGNAPACLESALMVKATPYWRSHFDLDTLSPRPLRHLLGGARAREIVVNVVLPFALAYAGGETYLASRSREIFAAYPRLESNSLERHLLLQLNLDSKFASSARLQQGLIHLYRAFCCEGQCGLCPLSRSKA